MIFLTVGTQFPFDRLVKAVDEAVGKDLLDEEIFAQIGDGSYQPIYFKAVAWLEKHQFDEQMQKASRVISHAGMGAIISALENKKQLLVMPRMKRYKEHVNDHQVATAKKFEELGYLLAVYRVQDLPVKIRDLKTFVPRKQRSQAKKVVERVSIFLNELCESGK